MKLGIFDFEVIDVRESGKLWFQPILKIDGEIVQTYGLWKYHDSALNAGIEKLEELFQGALDSLKPKYQTKSKVVDAVQWNGDLIEGITVTSGGCDYYNMPIWPGDWIINGIVVTNEQFEQDYEVIT